MNLPNFCHGTSLNFESFRGTNHTVSCYTLVFSLLFSYNDIFTYISRNWCQHNFFPGCNKILKPLVGLACDKYGILFTISGFVYLRFSHFHHFGTLKISTIDLPISILLRSLHPKFNRTLLHRFLALFT